MGFLSSLFGKGKKSGPSEPFVNPITTELHSHLIPGIDDGVQSVEEAVEIIEFMHTQMGYQKIITTPHIMGDFYKNSRKNIMPGLEAIREALAEKGLSVQVDAAAEYMVDEAFDQKIEKKELLTFGKDQKLVLIELPFMTEPFNFRSALFELKLAGYKPVLAHPERYTYFYARRDKYEELIDQGIYFQLNMLSLTGHYSTQTQRIAEFLIDKKMVHFVGSDAHNMKHAVSIHNNVIPGKLYHKLMQLELMNNEL